ncbi:MAG: hypothetical protein MUP03_05600, partial [Anaerolineales bacterium]|nr:hypothetical protein [Anaerolineales bacterium]
TLKRRHPRLGMSADSATSTVSPSDLPITTSCIIAYMAGVQDISIAHLAEALNYRPGLKVI